MNTQNAPTTRTAPAPLTFAQKRRNIESMVKENLNSPFYAGNRKGAIDASIRHLAKNRGYYFSAAIGASLNLYRDGVIYGYEQTHFLKL